MNTRAALSLLLILFASCYGPAWIQTPVETSPDFRIGLERHQRKGEPVALGYDHPRALDVGEIEFLLNGLRYSDPRLIGGGKSKRVFHDYEVVRLAPALVLVLAGADPDSRVWFTSYNLGDGSSIFRETHTTDGVLFIDPAGVLNLAFSRIDEVPAFDENEIATMPTQAYTDPVLNTRSTTPLIAQDWCSLKVSADGEQHQLWAVVELDALREAFLRGAEVPPPSPAEGRRDAAATPAPIPPLPASIPAIAVTGEGDHDGREEGVR